MPGKLTLSIDPDLIVEGKRLAALRGTSVSALVADFFRTSAAQTTKRRQRRGRTPILDRWKRPLAIPEHRDDTDLLTDALVEKHGPA